MTGESDVHSPLVLKLPKSAWLRASSKASVQEFGDYQKMAETSSFRELKRPAPITESPAVSPLNKYRRQPCRRLGSPEQAVEYLRCLLKPLSESQQHALVPVDESEASTNAIGSMTYQELTAHIASLRLEFVQRLMRPLLQRLMLHPRNNNVFNVPVDPVALSLPDYAERVPSPMDLGTVKARLQLGQYSSLQQCAADIELVFRNAMSYNPEGNAIHTAARCLLEEFEFELTAVYEKHAREVGLPTPLPNLSLPLQTERRTSHSCSVCSGESCALCGEKCLRFEAPVLVCHGSCGQRIKRNGVFFTSSDACDVYCQRCYGNLPSLVRSSADRQLWKRELLKRRVEEEAWEPWLGCDSCGSWVHKVCALVSDLTGEAAVRRMRYHCPLCRLEEVHSKAQGDSGSEGTDAPSDADSDPGHVQAPRGGAVCWRASNLPRTKLSDFIEAMLGARLNACGFAELARSLTVRVTSNTVDSIRIPAPIVNNFVTPEGRLLPAELPYRQKSILLFQRIDGVDVCLFSLYVQEFDAQCPQPNARKVYVAYLDSVEFMHPREARTMAYHEILVSYLKWAQARGFDQAHIWACPPQRGDNFIFWSHPGHQRTPSRERLNNWYSVMLKRCEQLGIAREVGNLWTTHFAQLSRRYKAESRPRGEIVLINPPCEQPISPPIFEGDFWVLECLRLHRYVQSRAGQDDLERGNCFPRVARDMLRDLLAAPAAHYFAQPVNPVALNIPSYPEVIKNPMDLGTVRSRLRQGQYSSLLDFAGDIRLTFCNATTFNPPGHYVHCVAASLLQGFECALAKVVIERGGDDANLDSFLRACSLQLSERTVSAPSLQRSSSSSSEKSPDRSDASPEKGQIVSFASGTCFESGCDATEMRRSTSFDSALADEDEEESWGRRPLYSAPISRYNDVALRSSVEKSEMSSRGLIALMNDLGKSVFRLKDDLFVINLASKNSLKRSRHESDGSGDEPSEDGQGLEGKVPTNNFRQHGKQKKIPSHLFKSVKKAPVSYYSLRQPEESVSESNFSLLDGLKPNTEDPDPLFGSSFVNTRNTFLEMCQFRHYQFDSLRRAKYSSLMLLIHLQSPDDTSVLPHCCNCQQPIEELRWHCDQCVDIDFCDICRKAVGHDHSLTPFRVTFKRNA